MLINSKKIERRMRGLIGVKAARIFRSEKTLTLLLGLYDEKKNDKGEPVFVSDYFIDVQCMWRILSSEGIVIGFRDFFHPEKELTNEEYARWDWDKDGNNRFDVISRELTQLFQDNEIVVERVCTDKYGGFSLFLSNGFELQVIPDHSERHSFWRFTNNMKKWGDINFL